MTKLNWRNASKELPKKTDRFLVYEYASWRKIKKQLNIVWFDSSEKEFEDSNVLYWLPLNEIPLPEDGL